MYFVGNVWKLRGGVEVLEVGGDFVRDRKKGGGESECGSDLVVAVMFFW